MPVSWQTRLFWSSATWTFLTIVSSTRLPGTEVSRCCASDERVAQVLRDVLQRPDVEVRRGVLDGLPEIDRDGAHAALSAAAWPARRPKTVHSSKELPIIRLRPWVPPAISPQA